MKQETAAAYGNLPEHAGLFAEFWRSFRKNKLGVLGLTVLAVILLLAVLAPLLATADPVQQNLAEGNQKLPPSRQHFFGTDDLGRDIWSRVLYGGRISLVVGFLTMFFSVSIGTLYGALAGYYGGRVDQIMMRFVDILLSIPTLFLLIILAAFIRPNPAGIALIIGLTSWMSIARLVRAEFLRLKGQEFVEAARVLGCSEPRVIFRHILPNVTAPIIVNATLMVASAILYESTLSFLGLGVTPPDFSWGSMLTDAQNIILLEKAPWIPFFPGLAIFLTVLAFSFVGDALRDALDPRLKNVK
ncbi:MAG TPA: ABC transporter permease [Firmicutes bacterium]|nr:ABC transporter permease [Bacillota bacterium]